MTFTAWIFKKPANDRWLAFRGALLRQILPTSFNKCGKFGKQIYLRPSVKYDCHRPDVQETRAASTDFRKELPHRIS
jgi:hypothetical protein